MSSNRIVNVFTIYDGEEIVAQATSIIEKENKNMSCSCERCVPKFLGHYKATAAADGNDLVITLCSICPAYILQGDRLSFNIVKCITYPTTRIDNVYLDVNGTKFELIKFGNVKWDQIKSREKYVGVFGTEEPTFTILNDLPCSKYEYPTYTTTSTTTETE